ncbi:MAG TPA: ATP-binding protein [Thermoanaerobaculia bacterium]|nr:ATP-binding protein [Thermoanaerobaculia bacterium]
MKRDSIDFSAEAGERIETARSVLSLGRAPRIGEINELFRAVHSLKGLAGLKGFSRFAGALHEAESLLDAIRLSKIPWSPRIAEALERFLLRLEAAIAASARSGDDAGFSAGDALAPLAALRAESAAPARSPLSAAVDLPERTLSCLSEYEESRLRAHVASGTPIWTIDVAFPLDAFESALKALGARVNASGEWIATLPQVEGFSAERLAVQLLVALGEPPGGLPENARVRCISRLPEKAPVPREEPPRAAPVRTVRLEASRLDSLLAEVDEARARFRKLAEELFRVEQELPPARRVEAARVRGALDGSLERLARQAAAIRTVPISLLADRLSRAARRILDASGKKAAFRVVGGESEIDRSLAEDLADPLLHIVRNAVDHGIETPAERRAAGKPESGTVTLMARSRSSKLVLSIADDGRGIDTAAVVARARELGWVAPGAFPSEEEARAFLFRPGFSTAAAVSEISGRGVGLDLVAERVAARRGEIRVRSTPGRGTRFEIEIAIAQAVFDALVVMEGDRPYAFPLAAIARVDRAASGDGAVPLSRLLRGAEPAAGSHRISVFLPDASAISVSQVLRQEMLVVRPVETQDPPPYLIGASQGRGDEAVLVLDPKRVFRHAAGAAAAGGAA